MESERLIFRELQMSDAFRLFEIYSDEEAMKYRQVKPHQTIEDSFEMVKRDAEVRTSGFEYRFGIVEKETNILIGSVMYQPIGRKAILGYSFAKESWGKGYATEVVKWICNHIRAKNYQAIEAWVLHENIASQKVLEKNQFSKISQTIYPYSLFYKKQLT